MVKKRGLYKYVNFDDKEKDDWDLELEDEEGKPKIAA